jgi:hypothetical protein
MDGERPKRSLASLESDWWEGRWRRWRVREMVSRLKFFAWNCLQSAFSAPDTDKSGVGNGIRWSGAMGVIIMIENATPDLKSRIKIYAVKLVDYSWDAALVITFLFGAIVLAMLIFALAINYKLISPPPLLCHYMVGGLHIEEFCK